MITEDYCSYNVCELLKKKGFNEACTQYYHIVTTLDKSFPILSYTEEPIHNSELGENSYVAPTHQKAMKLVLEKQMNIILAQMSLILNRCGILLILKKVLDL